MLVEDDKSLREIYGVRLQAEGYEIKSAGDGEEALAMAIKEKPNLILADVMMPKISGFDMLDILRSTPDTKDIKVIIMTALSSEDQRARGESLGADRYLVKSQVGIEDVVRTIHDVLADMPIPATPSNETFSTPAPTAILPTQPIQPSMPNPAPITTIAPEPITIAEAEPVTIPQPTAPFSTSAPSSIRDSIISPLPRLETPINNSIPITTPETVSIIDTPPTTPTPPVPVQSTSVMPTPSIPPTPDVVTMMSEELNKETTTPTQTPPES